MNNGYFNPAFMRSVPTTPFINYGYPYMMNNVSTVPRIGSLFGNSGGASKITFSGILNGASKTLGVINQAIPVFYQVKPIWNNAKTMFRVVKGINSVNSIKKYLYD